MDFGLSIPTRGSLATRDTITEIAQRAEALGFVHFAVPDHLVVPRTIDSRYPYSANGEYPGRDSGECIEQLTLMAYLAAITSKAKLLSSVMVVPHRSPMHAAKVLSSIDVLSNGRLALGIGAGWMEEEFKAIGTPPFAERGKVTDEYIEIFKTLWIDEAPEFDGRYASFSNVTFLPKPVQCPGPQIWVGGESTPALKRTVRIGDVWYPIGSNPHHPLDTLARFRAGLAKLEALAEEAGRDPKSIGIAYFANWISAQPLIADTGERHLFTGGREQFVEDAAALRDIGVEHVLFNFQRDSKEETIIAMESFASDVMPYA